jgi:hypothetical protein
MTISYNLGIPAQANDPSADQPNMLINTNSTSQIIGIDHVTFQNVLNPNGYHTIIHQTLQPSDPAAIAGYNQVYAKNYTPDSTGSATDTQLYSRTGLGGISQLTGHFATTDGWQWVGGVLIQWGRFTRGGSWPSSGIIVFKDRVAGAIPFPTACFMVQLTLSGPVGSTNGDMSVSAIGANQFTWQTNMSSSAAPTGFYWFAVGN